MEGIVNTQDQQDQILSALSNHLKCVGYMRVGCTTACIDIYKGRGPLEHNPKGCGVHGEP